MKAPTRTPVSVAVIRRLQKAFQNHLSVNATTAGQLLSGATMADKAYELRCLVALLNEFKRADHRISFTLQSGTEIRFRSKGGPINRRRWPCIIMQRGSHPIAEIWTNIEFEALSATNQNHTLTIPTYGDTHELDLILTRPNISDGYPKTRKLLIGVEAKHRPYNKSLLKELLGVRREMALRSRLTPHHLTWWHSAMLPCSPPSILIAYCGYASISDYDGPSGYFGLRMDHLPL